MLWEHMLEWYLGYTLPGEPQFYGGTLLEVMALGDEARWQCLVFSQRRS